MARTVWPRKHTYDTTRVREAQQARREREKYLPRRIGVLLPSPETHNPAVEIEVEYMIETDGKTVWVNASDGCCLGRFSRGGIDVHRDFLGQVKADPCLDCSPGPATLEMWERFKSSMLSFHRVVVTDDHLPEFLRA